ncbi:hypothetical protein TKK_0014681 [Trichogramma kaykai]|uniref:Uncharacterized protein n=1 Tax=Trichogramma kaykai TaxID=54128 RepID=A0ABD2WCQ1_9HYME
MLQMRHDPPNLSNNPSARRERAVQYLRRNNELMDWNVDHDVHFIEEYNDMSRKHTTAEERHLCNVALAQDISHDEEYINYLYTS